MRKHCLGRLGICLEILWGACEIEQEIEPEDREQCKGNCGCWYQFCRGTGQRERKRRL